MQHLWTFFWLKKRVKDPQGQESQDNECKNGYRLNDWKLFSSLTHSITSDALSSVKHADSRILPAHARVFLYFHDPLQHCLERKPFIEESVKYQWNHSLTISPLVFSKWRKSAGISFCNKIINMNVLHCWSVQIILKYFHILFSMDNLLFVKQITSLKTRFT